MRGKIPRENIFYSHISEFSKRIGSFERKLLEAGKYLMLSLVSIEIPWKSVAVLRVKKSLFYVYFCKLDCIQDLGEHRRLKTESK